MSAATHRVEGVEPQPEQNEPNLNWKQVMGCLSANSTNFAVGFAMSYSSALIPKLQDPHSDVEITTGQLALLASSPTLIAPLGAILCGVLMEHFGRLAALHMFVLPFCIAWIVIATAHDFTALLIGRLVTGAALAAVASAGAVLVTETALKEYRGSLAAIGPSFVSLGILCEYTLGALLDWRTNAWVSLISPIVPFLLVCLFTAESPVWLKARGRLEQARRASQYYYGNPDYVVLTTVVSKQPPPLQNSLDIENAEVKNAQPNFLTQIWMLLTLPSGYKPFLILSVTFFLQQCTGIYITLYYAVTFYQEAGSAIDPYIATIMNGVARLVATSCTVLLLRHCKRRVLIISGTLGMAISMAASAYSTGLVLAELDGGPRSITPPWFPVVTVIVYIVAAGIGLQTIPWTMTSEIFPQEIRGTAQSFNLGLAHVFMFATLQVYPEMNTLMGGSVGIQYFFAGVSLFAAIFLWVFYPEPHGKTLTEIEEYFVHNTIYLGHKKI